MPFSKEPQTRIHLVVLWLCVAACLALALRPGREDLVHPVEDAAVLVRGVMIHSLERVEPPSERP